MEKSTIVFTTIIFIFTIFLIGQLIFALKPKLKNHWSTKLIVYISVFSIVSLIAISILFYIFRHIDFNINWFEGLQNNENSSIINYRSSFSIKTKFIQDNRFGNQQINHKSSPRVEPIYGSIRPVDNIWESHTDQSESHSC